MLAFIVRVKTRALLLAAVAVLLTGGAAAAGTARSVAPRAAHPSGAHRAPAGPHRLLGAANAARVAAAAQTCSSYAAAAGWANNGSLVTASAVCMAESGGQASVYYCEATGHDGAYPPVACRGHYDRGLWQLNSAGQPGTTDVCAFTPQCNANAAYAVSDRGTSFAAWSVYANGGYARYVGDAQEAVSALASGTVASGVLGVCLARRQYAGNAPVVSGLCGTGVPQQQWSTLGGTIRRGQFCAAPASAAASAIVWLRRCNGLTWQQWTQSPTGQLRNTLTGGCLSDPGGSLAPGTRVTVAPCAAGPALTWWLS
jgi:hypothetical protein